MLSIFPVSNYCANASSDIVTFEVAAGGWLEMPTFTLDIDWATIIANSIKSLNIPSTWTDPYGNPHPVSSYYSISTNYSMDTPFKTALMFMGRAKFEHPIPVVPNISLLYSPIHLDGAININGTVTATTNFPQGFPISNNSASVSLPTVGALNVSADMYDVAFYSGLPFLKTATLGWLNIDLGLNVKVITIPAYLIKELGKNVTLPINFVPLPTLYVAFQVAPFEFDFISLEGELRFFPGIIVSKFTSDYVFYMNDFLVRAKYTFFDPLFVDAGYRYQNVYAGAQGATLAIISQGPFAEVGAKF
jgi:hypothetical protein